MSDYSSIRNNCYYINVMGHLGMKSGMIILSLILCSNIWIDTWDPPITTNYYNTDSSFYVKIVPQKIPEKYWNWASASVKKRKRFSPSDTLIIPCHAKMFRITEKGDSLIWEQKLINRVAPVTVIVSNNGKYVITFDNWHSMGYGVDVLAYYNEKGELIKRHMLEDISPFPINTYQMSISSLWWRCGQQFIDDERISICFIDDFGNKEERIYNLREQKIEENAP